MEKEEIYENSYVVLYPRRYNNTLSDTSQLTTPKKRKNYGRTDRKADAIENARPRT